VNGEPADYLGVDGAGGGIRDAIAEGDVDIEDMIADQQMVISLTASGYAKRLPLATYRQMNGLSGDYQMRNPPERGIAANMGGDDRTCVVTLYRKS